MSLTNWFILCAMHPYALARAAWAWVMSVAWTAGGYLNGSLRGTVRGDFRLSLLFAKRDFYQALKDGMT